MQAQPLSTTPQAQPQQEAQVSAPPQLSKWGLVDDLNRAAEVARNNDDEDGYSCAKAGAAWVGTLQFPDEAAGKQLVLPDQRGVATSFEIARLQAREARVNLKTHRAKIALLRDAIASGAPRAVVIACAVVVHDAKRDLIELLGLAGILSGL